jgi:xylulokinase
MKYILVYDLGTSGNKATLFTTDGEIVKSKVVTYETFYSGEVSVEQNPNDWWDSVIESTKYLIEGIKVEDVAAISFSGHMQGMVCMDKQGELLYNSLIWMDQRSVPQMEQLRLNISEDRIYEITGNRLSSIYTLEKLMWMRDEKTEIYNKIYKVLNTKDYIIYKLTGEYVTDYSDASGTNALDITNRCWSKEILEAANVSLDIFPTIHESIDVVGYVSELAAELCGLIPGIPVVCGGGDGACATIGAGCIEEGDAYCLMGSSAQVAMTSDFPIIDPKKAIFNLAHVIPGKFIPCGAMTSSGIAYQWGIDLFAKVEKRIAEETGVSIHELVEEKMRNSSVGANKLVFLPYLHGERSPRWNPDARGVFFGLTSNHTTDDMLRAILEGVIFNLGMIFDVFKKHIDTKEINLIGGGASTIQQQILSDVFEVPVHTIENSRSASAIGAAVIAGVGAGLYEDFDAVYKFIKLKETYKPNEEHIETYSPLKEIFDQVYLKLESLFKLL